MVKKIYDTADKCAMYALHGRCAELFTLHGVVVVVTFLASLQLTAIFLYGQSTGRGVISGTVTDPMGDAVVNARILVTDSATNVSRSSTTNDTGYFQVDSVNPSTYNVTVIADGFEKMVRRGITLTADARINLPLALRLGSTEQSVVVSADADLLNTETASTGFVLTTRQVENLPASGTNPMMLVSMYPGMQSPNPQSFTSGDTLSWPGVSKFGATGYLNANEWSIDGMPAMANPRGNGMALSQEEVAEMKVEPVSFDAAVGHTMGATITQTTKAGTNELHGALHQTYQDQGWAAMQHFQALNYRYQQIQNNCVNGSSDPTCLALKYKYGQPDFHYLFGSYAVGGPVYIPKLYDGRNKLFFFVDADYNPLSNGAPGSVFVPTMKERSGDFSDLPTTTTDVPAEWQAGGVCAGSAYYGQYQLYNPFSVTIDPSGRPSRMPFCGNVIPSNLLAANSKMVSFYNSLLPVPTNGSSTSSNYAYTSLSNQYSFQITNRFDYAASEKDHFYFRWTRMHYNQDVDGFTIDDADHRVNAKWSRLGSFGYDHVFNPTTNMIITVGGTDWKEATWYPNYQKLAPSSLGLPSYLDSYGGAAPTLPYINLGSNTYAQIGQEQTSPQTYRDLSFSVLVNHVRGNHSFRAGGEFRQQSLSQPAQGWTSGQYLFNNAYIQQNDGSNRAYPSSNLGLSYAAFLLGIPTQAQVTQGSSLSIRTPYVSSYLADTWRVTSKLTLNLGLRYEYEWGPSEQHNAMIVGWDPNATLPFADAVNQAYQAAYAAATPAQQAVMPSSLDLRGGPMYAGVNGAPTREFANGHRLLPRFGVAYRLTQNTVIRGGYGIYSDTINVHACCGSPHPGILNGSWGGIQFSVPQDGYSTSTTAVTSTTYGTNFVAGATPLINPFPSGFQTAAGNSIGSLEYLGANPTIYDHNLKPARAQRGYVGVQHQFGASTMVELAWLGSYASDITIEQNMTPLPKSFYSGGNQPNATSNALLSTQITNPFNVANLGSLATTNPAVYQLISLNGNYTAAKINLSNVLRADPQLFGLNMWRSVGASHFNEFQANVTHRYAGGLTLLGSLQLNEQKDADYFANPYDSTPTWEPSNNSMPYRITAAATYDLPFGKGRAFANSGILSKILGGFQIASSWEHQAGALLEFGNLFYIGDPTAGNIKLKNPQYANNLGAVPGGYNYVQWLNVGDVTATYDKTTGACTYSGTGFVTNPNCQPNGYNDRVFPHRIAGLRQQPLDTLQASLQRKFRLSERFGLELRCDAFNVLNHQVLAAPITSPTASNFGQIIGDSGVNTAGGARWINVQVRLRF